MAKGVKGSTPKGDNKPHKTTFIIDPTLMKSVKYVSLVDDREITSIVDEALTDFIKKWEVDHGKIKIK